MRSSVASNSSPTHMALLAAAMVLGHGDSIAYDQLVERVTGHRPDKTHRFTDWSRRPLTPEQMHYAVFDVTQVDVEMSFPTEEDVYEALAEGGINSLAILGAMRHGASRFTEMSSACSLSSAMQKWRRL